MTEKKPPRERSAKAEASDEFSETPMERFRALAKRLTRVSKDELQRQVEEHNKKKRS